MLRQPQEMSLGLRYVGERVSREELGGGGGGDGSYGGGEGNDDRFGSGASSDGPFGSGQSRREEGSREEDEVVDPDEVDVDMATGELAEDEDIDSEEAFGEGDEEAFKGFTFRGSGIPRETASGSGKRGGVKTYTRRAEDEDGSSDLDRMDEETTKPQDGSLDGEDDSELDEDSMSLDGSASSDNDLNHDGEASDDSDASSTDNSSPSHAPLPPSRAALRQMMAESQSTVLATISLAAKADATKGRAVQRQHSTFDTLLNTRIRLQKALSATNALSATPLPAEETATIHAAETAALALFGSLSALLHALHPSLSPLPPATRTTPTSALATAAHALSTASRPHHRATLAKWAAKTHLPSTLPPRSRLTPQPTTQPLLSVLDAHLSPASLPRLLARTRLPRSSAPLQSTTITTTTTNPTPPTLFDDADFYALLLRELVERKMAARTAGRGSGVSAVERNGDMDASALTRAAKVRKAVDTKASKGRKMRYAVHERLQNFMAREEGRGWEEGRVGELFGGLLGRRVVGGLGEGVEDGEEGEGEGEAEEGALRLFGGGA